MDLGASYFYALQQHMYVNYPITLKAKGYAQNSFLSLGLSVGARVCVYDLNSVSILTTN